MRSCLCTYLLLLGLLLIANSNDVGKLFGDREADIFNTKELTLAKEEDGRKIDHYFWTVIVLVIGAVAVDFSSDTLQNPSRAYVLDVCVVGNYNRNSIILLLGILKWYRINFSIICNEHLQLLHAILFFLFVLKIPITRSIPTAY